MEEKLSGNDPESLSHLGLRWLVAIKITPNKTTVILKYKGKVNEQKWKWFLCFCWQLVLTQPTHHVILPFIVTDGLVEMVERFKKTKKKHKQII